MDYLPFLATAHRELEPQTYLEIGVSQGHSMALSHCRSVGIDPLFSIKTEIDCHLTLFRTSSDEYFTRPDPLAPTGGQPFDLAFIDGLHLFEFTLRDFINAERYCTPRSLIILDDMLPRTVDEAARERHTYEWAGDLYPILAVFDRYRPDLVVLPVDTTPTGMVVVFGLDPSNTALSDNYDEIMAEFRSPDPQPVPESVLDRLTAYAPERVLDAPFWRALADAPRDASPAEVRALLDEPLRAGLGAQFAQA
ncbi:class I SAM-dependent methyltransferase [uncultured Jatrophihabitans sp.]|uniref:class I SAM-dependent methyltransferase n=1 Tax=uncultured Jatrophihabitans sp. TaxID=1610747 RepID=UPI0035CA7440